MNKLFFLLKNSEKFVEHIVIFFYIIFQEHILLEAVRALDLIFWQISTFLELSMSFAKTEKIIE